MIDAELADPPGPTPRLVFNLSVCEGWELPIFPRKNQAAWASGFVCSEEREGRLFADAGFSGRRFGMEFWDAAGHLGLRKRGG